MYDKVLELLKEKNYSELKKLLSDMNEADINTHRRTGGNAAAFIPYITEGACGRRICKYGFGRAGDTHKSLQRYRA